jgi:tetratricopeptide (TPR) repeat protein
LTQKSPALIRLDIVRSHLALGEVDEALCNLEKVIACDPDEPELLALLEEPETARQLPPEALRELESRVPGPSWGGDAAERLGPPLATPTMAQLLAEQGHSEKALQVAEDVLRRDPQDERARAVHSALTDSSGARGARIEPLERWLAQIRRRRQGDACA